jgi:soluble lytic murein transglycosylase-like protein
MSYSSALTRVNEIRERIGVNTAAAVTPSAGFQQVMANAINRFDEGPTKINGSGSAADDATWGRGVNVVAATQSKGSPSASLAAPNFPTPNKVNGWSTQMRDMADAASERFGVPRELVIAVSRAESAFRSDAASPAGAKGLMQLMPGTAKGLGVTDITDPWQNLAGGTKYLRQLMDRFHGDVTKVIAGYNAGPNAVQQYGGVPPYSETRTYVARVLGYAKELGWQPGAADS